MASFPTELFPVYHPNPDKETDGKTIITREKSRSNPDVDFNTVGFGKLCALLVEEDGRPVFKQPGGGVDTPRVSYVTCCLPLLPPSTRTVDDVLYDPVAERKLGVGYINQQNLSDLRRCYYQSGSQSDTAQSSTVAHHKLRSDGVCFVPYSSGNYLLYPGGVNQSQLIAALLHNHLNTDSANDESPSFSSYATSSAVLRATTVQTVDLPGRLHQVACSTISPSSSRATVCILCDHDIVFLEMSVGHQTQQLLSVLATHHSTTAISSIAVCPCSPYLFGEAVFVTEAGGVHHWSQETGVTSVAQLGNSSWQCVYGPHPRCMIVASQTSVVMIDFILSPSSSHPLLTYPSLHLPNGSIVSAIAQHPSSPFSVFIATTHTIISMDIRQPHEPLLVMKYETEGVVNHLTLSTCSALDDAAILLLAISTHTRETIVYTISASESDPPRVLLPPHAVDSYSDFALKEAPKDSNLHRRLSQPVAGACLAPLSSNNVACFLLSGLGDLFFQCWCYTMSPSQPRTIPPAYQLWIQQATEQERSLRIQRDESSDTAKLDCTLLHDYVTSSLSDSGMCVKCVSVSCEDGLFAHIDPTSHLTTPPPPLSGATCEHRCTFCGEWQWAVKEREIDGKEFVEQMSEKCGREESLSRHDEVKRLWDKWEDDGGEQNSQMSLFDDSSAAIPTTPTTAARGDTTSRQTPRSAPRLKIRRMGF